jgi:hypothetical protein
MKYLHFENANQDYNGYEGFIPVLIGSSWVGLAEVEDKVAKELKGTSGVTELSQKDWEWYKKKVGGEKIAYRDFITVKQEPEKNPNASYVEEVKSEVGKPSSSDNPKDLIEVDVVEVEKPLEETEQSASKPKKGKK